MKAGLGSVAVEERDGAAVAYLDGEITSANAREIGEWVLAQVDGHHTLTVEVSGVSYLSSAGLRVLVLLHRRAEAAGVKVLLAGLSPRLRFMMRAVGFLELFTEAEETP
ncbi:STAS domain-containing protein [Actinospica robiniae]|uniref:STAS domain-containing protein n=1 Tax=Actinospica robiniae TaxID=304901 RepID=UPI00041C4347|nr:STAS domain-containing protein [Actinospica robiniae]